MSIERSLRKSSKSTSRFNLDYSSTFFCFILDGAASNEKYTTIAFGSPYWPRDMTDDDKIKLAQGDKVFLRMYARLYSATLIAKGNERQIAAAMRELSSLVSEAENTDSLVDQAIALLGASNSQSTIAKATDRQQQQPQLASSAVSSCQGSNSRDLLQELYNHNIECEDNEDEEAQYFAVPNPNDKVISAFEKEASTVQAEQERATGHLNSSVDQEQSHAMETQPDTSMQGIKEFIHSEMIALEKRLTARISRLLKKDTAFSGTLTIKEYADEDFRCVDGSLASLSSILCNDPKQFIKRYIRLRFGDGYLMEHIIDSASGRRSARRPAPAEHVAEFQRLILLCYRTSGFDFTEIWKSVREHLNQLAREETRAQKRSASAASIS